MFLDYSTHLMRSVGLCVRNHRSFIITAVVFHVGKAGVKSSIDKNIEMVVRWLMPKLCGHGGIRYVEYVT